MTLKICGRKSRISLHECQIKEFVLSKYAFKTVVFHQYFLNKAMFKLVVNKNCLIFK